TNAGRSVTWKGLTVPAGCSRDVTFTVHVGSKLKSGTTSIVNDGYKATSAEGQSATGSPLTTRFAPPHAVSLAPATQVAGAHPGQAFNYHMTLRNRGSAADSYALSAASTYPAQVLDSACSTALPSTASIAPGASTDVCVRVTVP